MESQTNSKTPQEALQDYLTGKAKVDLGTAAVVMQDLQHNLKWERDLVSQNSATPQPVTGEEMGDIYLGDVSINQPPQQVIPPVQNASTPANLATPSSGVPDWLKTAALVGASAIGGGVVYPLVLDYFTSGESPPPQVIEQIEGVDPANYQLRIGVPSTED